METTLCVLYGVLWLIRRVRGGLADKCPESGAQSPAYALAPCSAPLDLSLRCKHSFRATSKRESTARRRTHYLRRSVFAPKYRSTMGSLENPSVTLDDGRDCLRQAAASEDEKLLLSPQIYRCAFLG